MGTGSRREAMASRMEAGSSERATWRSALFLAAIGAGLLLLLGRAWFATSAGADYPEPVAVVAE